MIEQVRILYQINQILASRDCGTIDSKREPELPTAAEAGEQTRGEPDVSEHEQPGGTHPHFQPRQDPPAHQANEVVVDVSGAWPTYANFCQVTATPEEVILDFGLNPQPFTAGRQVVKANQRIVMNVYTSKRLLAVIGMTIQGHEQTFGAIEVDVNRRVSPPPPQFAPAGARGPAGLPQVVRLK
jgi:hypothetical protein